MRCDTISNFLSNEECIGLIELAKSRLAPSTGWDVATGKPALSDYRVSDQAWLQPGENKLVRGIEERIAKVVGIPIENGEGFQVVRYGVGGYYKPHWDYFDPRYAGNASVINRGGQRIVTAMLYLNNVEEGGETYFPKIDVSVFPETGKLFVWFNVIRDSINEEIDTSTYHEARPVIKGEKWIATKWLRVGRFH